MRARIAAGVAVVLLSVAAAALIDEPGGPEIRATRRITAVTPVSVGDLPDIGSAVAAHNEAVATWVADQQRQIDEYLAWRYEQDVAAWVAAHRPPPAPRVASSPRPEPAAADFSGGDCSTVHWAAREIYMRESGCNPAIWGGGGGGCFGIGQACPGSKVSYCGADFACQHAWFTGYAFSRYGSWENAWAAWQRQHWW